MIASEELEDVVGWYYSEWIKELSENPSMQGKRLGTLICRSTYDYMIESNNPRAFEATFSLIDLSPEKWLPLRKAYNSFNKNYFKSASKNQYLYTTFDTSALLAEHYNEGYVDGKFKIGMMLDLKDFAENIKANFPYGVNPSTRKLLTNSANDLISAIDSAVAYNVSGELRNGSNGISSYYPLDRNETEFELYASQNVVFKYTKELYGDIIAMAMRQGMNAADNQSDTQTRSRKRSSASAWNEIFDLSDLHNLEIELDDDSYEVSAELTQEQMRKTSNIQSIIVKGTNGANPAFGIDGRGIVYLGTRAVKTELVDDKYRLSDKLKATCPALNDHFIYTVTLETRSDTFDADGNLLRKGYTIYGIPVVLNDEYCLLRVAYFPSEQRYQIIGARPSGEKAGESQRSTAKRNVGMATREFITLKKGDRVAPIFLSMVLTENNEVTDESMLSFSIDDFQGNFKFTAGETFTLDEDPFVIDKPLEDNNPAEYDENMDKYAYVMAFYSPRGNSTVSMPVTFEISDGEIFDAEVEEPSVSDDEKATIIYDDEEYTYYPSTGKFFKDGEEYFLDPETGKMTKLKG